MVVVEAVGKEGKRGSGSRWVRGYQAQAAMVLEPKRCLNDEYADWIAGHTQSHVAVSANLIQSTKEVIVELLVFFGICPVDSLWVF